jgi:hypothetical protein
MRRLQENPMRQALVPVAFALLAGVAMAKLPAPDDAAKAKAAEAAAKAAWQGKVDAYALCKVQDRIAAQYHKTAAHPAAQTASQTPAPAAPQVQAAATPASGAASAAAATGTPVAAKPPPPCADPGPFAYNQPAQKPLETSEAHSPAGTAASPPSVKDQSGVMQPPKKP